MSKRNVVVFDFDLTLTRWETAGRFFKCLLRRQPWRIAGVVLALPVLAPLWALPHTRRLPVRFAVWVDLPLLRNSEQWFLISPGLKCLRLIEEAMATKAEILPWRAG